MPSRSAFVEQVVHQLNQVAPVTVRSMFGGYGVYAEGVMFALIAYDTLFFKVDDINQGDYVAAGSQPFTYDRNGKPIEMSYYQLPDSVFEDVGQLADWVESACDAARRSKSTSKRRKKKSS